jgi:hypothetical protein
VTGKKPNKLTTFKIGTLNTFECLKCGIQFESKGNPRYCSNKCKGEAYSINRKEKIEQDKLANSFNDVCEICEKTFFRESGKPRVCSTECALIYIEKEFIGNEEEMRGQTYKRSCPYCCRGFLTKDYHMIFCCNSHKMIYLYKFVNSLRQFKRNQGICANCGDIIYSGSGVAKKFCNDMCARAFRKKEQDKETTEH